MAGPSVLTLATATAARAQDDAAWQRACERRNPDGERSCEVRHTRFQPKGSTLDVEPDKNGAVEVLG